MSSNDAADPKNIISVVLIPDKSYSNELFALSKTIVGSEFHLDGNHLPHVTIIQFKAESSELYELKKQIDEINNQISEVFTNGINFVSDLENNLTWAEVLVLKSEVLQELQARVLSLPFAKDHEIKDWGTGNRYRPHITLGVLVGSENKTKVELENHKKIANSPIKVSLEVGENGEYYSFVKPYNSNEN